MTDEALVYVADPMCSWCWGFAPSIAAATETTGLPVELVLGGLRPGPYAEPLNDRMRAYLTHHWQQVHERSGQQFDLRGLEREGWVYDTEPASRAVASVRSIAPDETLGYFHDVQRAFYAEVRDVTDPDVLADLAAGRGIERDPFLTTFADPATQKATWRDFARARNMGVSGFPTLFLRRGDRAYLVARGYAAPDEVLERIAAIRAEATG